MYRLAALFSLLFTPQLEASIPAPVLESMMPGSITFIGESHKHIESAALIMELMSTTIKNGQCPILALEIADSEQAAIDRVMNQGASVSDVAIPASIDHAPIRQMIENMARLKAQSPCLKVVAIDAGLENPYDRDQWMAGRLTKLVGDRPILVLIGALHTLKKVDWLVKSDKPSVAELLTRKGVRVRSFPQRWSEGQCVPGESRYPRFVSAEVPEALSILNGSLISLINAKPYKSARGVIDGFVLWECDRDKDLKQK